jgi:hypothetical protein
MNTRLIATLLGLVSFCLLTSEASGRTWHVNPEGTGDAPSVKAGIDSAAAGDTVLVQCGTYYEHDIPMKNGVCLTGEPGFPPCATLDAQHHGTLITCNASGFVPTFIEGLALTHAGATAMSINGSGLTVRDCVFRDNPIQDCVVGIAFGSPAFYNCVFHDNLNEAHGAAPVFSVAYMFTQPVLSHCTMVDNSAGVSMNMDGGITIENSIVAFCRDGYTFGDDEMPGPLILNCSNFFGNHAGGDAVIAAYGSACFSADPQFCGIRGSRNFFLQSDSPCAPGNHPAESPCGLIGALPVNCGKVDVERKSWGTIKSMYTKDK